MNRQSKRAFRAADPPRVVRDHTLDGRPVLLLGWWLDAAGQPEALEVATMTSTRQPYEVSHFPAPPGMPFGRVAAPEDEPHVAD
jgi:hypothetical protein